MIDSKPRPAPIASTTTRVHLDQDASGAYTYRLVDVATGQVLVELPREQVAELEAALA